MADFTPLTNSSTRKAIGCEKLEATPGNSASASRIFATSSSFVFVVVHSSRGLSVMMMSLSSTPIGSDAISARPVFETTSMTSGNCFKIFSALRLQIERLRQRDAWNAEGLHGNRTFIQRRQKFRADERNERKGTARAATADEHDQPGRRTQGLSDVGSICFSQRM